ncbi:MAG: FecR domain-containing protein [Bacteroidetes bacterium]|nr:FecR domain-containing protein [Bacteroidota bacterium]
MDHSLYRPEDFACDESYLRFYFKLDAKDISYWDNWIRTHPEKLDVIMSADQLIGFLSLQLPEEEFGHEYDRFTRAIAQAALLENTRNEIRSGSGYLPPTGTAAKGSRRRAFLLTVIVVGIVAVCAWLFESRRHVPPASDALNVPSNDRQNTGVVPLDIALGEGSSVRLQPGGELSWPQQFLPGKREVSLNGAAAFSIAPDVRRPFFVYCNGLVTRVLGTRFDISAGPHANTVEITVSSGKVEVSEKSTGKGLVLTPNQKLVYTTAGGRFETGLADHPQPLKAGLPPMVFKATSLREVFGWLESNYGIGMDVENEMLYNCRFTGTVPVTELHEVLKGICPSLHIIYEARGVRMLFKGAGCDSL